MRYLNKKNPIFKRFDLFLEQKEQSEHTFSDNALLQQVAVHVTIGDDEKILDVVSKALEHTTPQTVINDGLIVGMDEVSRLWSEGTYFLPQVILSSDTMQAGIALCEQKMGTTIQKKGLIITHTAEGDIHDIGQSIVNALLSAAGYEILNLGADVSVDRVVNACREYRPLMLTGTALMTTTMSAFPRIATKLKTLNLQIPFICGGGAVSEDFVTGFDLGVWGKHASWAVDIAEDALKGRTWNQIRAKWNG